MGGEGYLGRARGFSGGSAASSGGSGSAFFTVNSRRLRTLKEGGALHAECVEDTAKDVQLLCPVDVLDEYRMVKAFVERKEGLEDGRMLRSHVLLSRSH